MTTYAHAAPTQCLTLWGSCKYKPGFMHFDYVNPNAPAGGNVKLAETGTFDSLNPFILNGVKAPAVIGLFESLMTGSLDEPQAMYPLIAQSAEVAADNSWVEFTLNPKARWHDGAPITPDDVVFSFAALKEKADPTYKIMYTPIAACEKTGERKVRFSFADNKNRELPMLAASMPILPKDYYTKIDFEKTTLEPPLGSGPYKIAGVDPGRSIVYERVKDYWGKDLPSMRGQYNFDTIRYDMYRDENVALEAFKAGEHDFRQEYIARNWATAYDSPAIKDGRIIKREIPDKRPQGMQAFIFNTRKPQFSDARVREAVGLALDYEWVNKTIFYGAYARNASFFENTEFAAAGLPSDDERKLLNPFKCHPEQAEGAPKDLNPDSSTTPLRGFAQNDKDCLPSALFTQPFKNPTTDGSGNARENLLKAQALLEQAGWVVKDGKRVNARGEPLTIEFMLRQPTMERVIQPMRRNLERLGIGATIRLVDDSQYQKRLDDSDFDMVSVWLNRGIFYPGNEQMVLWHSSQAGVKGSANVAGVKSRAVDAMLAAVTGAKNLDELRAAGRALDRVLLWNHYVIPHWHSSSFRVAYSSKFALPPISPPYNLCFQCWWVKEGR